MHIHQFADCCDFSEVAIDDMLLEWDKESPITFKPNCTVAELDDRFHMEELLAA